MTITANDHEYDFFLLECPECDGDGGYGYPFETCPVCDGKRQVPGCTHCGGNDGYGCEDCQHTGYEPEDAQESCIRRLGALDVEWGGVAA